MHGFPLNDTPSSACPFGQNVAVTVASGANCGAAGAAARDVVAVLVQKPEPKRLQHSRATIVRGAAADADDEPAAAVRNGVPDHLAHAERRGEERIPFRAGDERNAGGLRHLHDRGTADWDNGHLAR